MTVSFNSRISNSAKVGSEACALPVCGSESCFGSARSAISICKCHVNALDLIEDTKESKRVPARLGWSGWNVGPHAMIEPTELNIESTGGDKYVIDCCRPKISSGGGSKLFIYHNPRNWKVTMADLTKLEEHLASRSYIEGWVAAFFQRNSLPISHPLSWIPLDPTRSHSILQKDEYYAMVRVA